MVRRHSLLLFAFAAAFLILFALPLTAATNTAHADHDTHSLEHRMMVLALQIGVILFAGYAGARVAKRLGIPVIIGEMLAGIVIGPYVLGSVTLPGFHGGLYPLFDSAIAISPELYGFAVIASIVLLFLMGLQTDLRLFLRFAFKGSVVGLAGAVFSVFAGVIVGYLVTGGAVLTPVNAFLGVVAIATSVDITARILSDRHKMASPEGVTILSASVIEDVVGITLLAVVLSVERLGSTGFTGGETWIMVLSVGGRALGVWLGFTALGVVFARQIGRALKSVKNPSQIAVLSLGLALIVAGLFETAGLAMIIGGYVMGLSLANTDIAYVVQEKIETVHQFFDPIFFTVIGMLINIYVIASVEVVAFGLLFALLATVAKLVGCGVPALQLGFNRYGALRIGTGMIPRGEVALIILSIGIGSGILDDRLFGVAIVMTLVTTLVAPPVFNRLLARDVRTTTHDLSDDQTVTTDFAFGSEELTHFLVSDVVETMQGEGFFVNASEGEHRIYHMRKDSVFIAMMATRESIHFTSRPEDVTLVNNIIFESIISLQQKVGYIKSVSKPLELRKTLVEKTNRAVVDWPKFLPVECIHLRLYAREKEEAIRELVTSLAEGERLEDPDAVLQAVLERERTMSTGMQNGVAIPHGRSDGVNTLSIAVGMVPDGVDFQALDDEPTKIIFLVASPKENPGPHLQVLAGIAGIVNSAKAREDMLSISSRRKLLEYMVEHSNPARK